MIRFIFLQIGFMLWSLWILGIGAHASIDREVIISSNSETASQEICLQDLAQDSWVKSRCSVDKKNCCRWSLDGDVKKTFKIAELQRALDNKDLGGIHLILKASDGNTSVQVEQTKRLVTENEIKETLTSEIQKRFPENIEVKVEFAKFLTPIFVALNSNAVFKYELPEVITNKFSTKVLSHSGEPLGWIQTTISKYSEVYVSKRTIRPTEKISYEDFELKKIDVSLSKAQGEDNVVLKNKFPEGVRARFTILSNTPLTTRSVEKSPIVQLGDAVTIVLKSDNNLRITTKGVAQGAGAIGDMVSVQLNRYNKTFKGKLQEGKTVEVSL